MNKKMMITARFVSLMGFACLVAFTNRCVATDEEQPNVLFIICDDLNCDIGCYDHPMVQTPCLDRFAAGGVRFTNAHCQFSLCGPSRASFMTGLYPTQNGIVKNAIRLRDRFPKAVTMSQAFENSGYTTVRIGKIYHYNVPRDIGNDGHDDPDSWTITVNPRGRDKIYEPTIFSLKPGKFGATLSWKADEGADGDQTDGIGATEAIKFLKEFSETKQPFFMAVGMYRPHTPYVAPRKYFDLYDPNEIEIPSVADGYLDTIPENARRSVTRFKEQNNLDPAIARKAIQAYYASISFADAQVGRILTALKQTGLDKNTIVVFTSDHGYHMGEHGHYQKLTLFENGTRVPLILSAPGKSKTGLVTDTPIEMIDFYPTLAELAKVNRPGYLQGVSQVSALTDATVRPRNDALSHLGGNLDGWSLRTERYRYTEWGENGAGGKELYERENDDAELFNLADKPDLAKVQSDLAARLRERVMSATTIPRNVLLLPEKTAPPKNQTNRARKTNQ